jgi:hypothetical protein
MKPRINAEALKQFRAAIDKHAARIELDVLADIARALGLRMRVELMEADNG